MIIERIIATVFTCIYYADTADKGWKLLLSPLLSLTYLDVAVSALSSTGK